MDLGLIGAIGGLGQAVSKIGDDIVKRRERALEWAQQEAMRQRELAAKREDATTSFQRDMTLTTLKEDRADARNDADNRAATERTRLIQGSEDARQSRQIQAQRDLAVLRGRIDKEIAAARGAVDEHIAQLRDQLGQDDTKAVQYGQPDKNGYAEVFIITNSGQVKRTGQKVYKPQTTSQVVGGSDDEL